MVTAAQALASIPPGLRDPLLEEYRTIVQNFLEQRWLPSELSGGRFSEIVYTILDGHAKKSYAAAPSKPANLPEACKKLESKKLPHIPHSFQILIPRMLPALYDVRNNRNVGHVGGDVNPNHMDAVVVLSMANWVMAELVRVFHSLSIAQAQQLVDALAEVRLPVIWEGENGIKRVLRPELKLHEQILLLVAACVPDASVDGIIEWVEHDNTKYVMTTMRKLHAERKIELTERTRRVRILPPGSKAVQDLIRKKNLTGIS